MTEDVQKVGGQVVNFAMRETGVDEPVHLAVLQNAVANAWGARNREYIASEADVF